MDSTDVAAAGLGGACWQSSSQACLCLDADGDGKVEYDDYAIISDYVSTLTADTQLQRVPAAPSTRRGNPFAHQGLLYDAEIGSYQNRARQYSPTERRYMQIDPLGLQSAAGLGYHDGANMYLAYRANPWQYVDPMGRSCWATCAICALSGIGVLPTCGACICDPSKLSCLACFADLGLATVSCLQCHRCLNPPPPPPPIQCTLWDVRDGGTPDDPCDDFGLYVCSDGQTEILSCYGGEGLDCGCDDDITLLPEDDE